MIELEKMKQYIETTGMKRKAIAKKAGIKESAFSLIMTGKRKCSAEEYARICSALGVKAQAFIAEEPKTERVG